MVGREETFEPRKKDQRKRLVVLTGGKSSSKDWDNGEKTNQYDLKMESLEMGTDVAEKVRIENSEDDTARMQPCESDDNSSC